MSRKHDEHTGRLIKYVKDNFNISYMSLWADYEGYNYCEEEIAYINNEAINAYPDLRGIDEFSDPYVHIIGEAKSKGDYLTRNLEYKTQVDVYINVLKTKQDPYLIYAVPTSISNEIRDYINYRLNHFQATNINFKVLYK